MRVAYSSSNLKETKRSYQYAVARNVLYRKGKVTELLINYEPTLQYSEWWKHHFGESEGERLQRNLSTKAQTFN